MNATPPTHVRQRPAGTVGRARDVNRDRLILEAVLDLLGEQGPNGLTMEAVASKAGVGKSTVYRRWGQMSDLLGDAVDTITFATAGPQTGVLRDDLVEGIIVASGCLDARRQRIISGLLNASNHDPELFDALRRRFIGSVADVTASAITAAAQANGPATDEPARPAAPGEAAGGEALDVTPTVQLPWPYTEMDLAVVIGLLTSLPHVTGRPLDRDDFGRIVDDVLLPLLDSRRQPR